MHPKNKPICTGERGLGSDEAQGKVGKCRLEAEARLSRESLIMSSDSMAAYHINNSAVETMATPNDNPPSDYFLKIWNSEAGDAFVNKTHLPSGGGDDPVLSSEIPPTSVSSLCCASTQNCCDQSLNRNEKVKDNGSQHCSSASFGWNGDCNVKTPEWVRQNKAIQELGPEHAVHCTGFEASFFWIFLIMMTRITTAVAFNKNSVQVFSSNLLSHGICT